MVYSILIYSNTNKHLPCLLLYVVLFLTTTNQHTPSPTQKWNGRTTLVAKRRRKILQWKSQQQKVVRLPPVYFLPSLIDSLPLTWIIWINDQCIVYILSTQLMYPITSPSILRPSQWNWNRMFGCNLGLQWMVFSRIWFGLSIVEYMHGLTPNPTHLLTGFKISTQTRN